MKSLPWKLTEIKQVQVEVLKLLKQKININECYICIYKKLIKMTKTNNRINSTKINYQKLIKFRSNQQFNQFKILIKNIVHKYY